MAILPDVLKLDLKVVFCGAAVGSTSARVGAYYAGPGNQFWDVLFRTGLTPSRLRPEEFTTLPSHGIGLTDLAKKQSGTDDQVDASEFDVDALRSKVRRFAPKALAFNGKRAGSAFYGRSVTLGRQPEPVWETAVFVLPSTSGAARGYWDELHWRGLAEFIGFDGEETPSDGHGQYRRTFASLPGTAGPVRRPAPVGEPSGIANPLERKAKKVDAQIIRYFEEIGVESAAPNELMPYLVRHGAFPRDHREGYPLRELCRRLYSAGRFSLMTTAHFDQKARNKSWYFLPPRRTSEQAPEYDHRRGLSTRTRAGQERSLAGAVVRYQTVMRQHLLTDAGADAFIYVRRGSLIDRRRFGWNIAIRVA